ncbi:unnamed protein product [Cunninghamella blakesleeana]
MIENLRKLYSNKSDIHISCMSHVISIAVNSLLSVVDSNINILSKVRGIGHTIKMCRISI